MSTLEHGEGDGGWVWLPGDHDLVGTGVLDAAGEQPALRVGVRVGLGLQPAALHDARLVGAVRDLVLPQQEAIDPRQRVKHIRNNMIIIIIIIIIIRRSGRRRRRLGRERGRRGGLRSQFEIRINQQTQGASIVVIDPT